MKALITTTPNFDDAVNQEEQLEKIITQKWIACWPEGMEAWAEQRRTGYPKLFKVQTNNSNGTIDTDIMIRRLPFSQDDAKKILSSIKICVRLLVVQTMAVHGYGGTQVKTTFNSYFSNNYYL